MRPAQEFVATPAQTRQESILSRYYPHAHEPARSRDSIPPAKEQSR